MPSFQNHQIHLTVPPVGVYIYIYFFMQFWLHDGVSIICLIPADVSLLAMSANTWIWPQTLSAQVILCNLALFGWRVSTKVFNISLSEEQPECLEHCCQSCGVPASGCSWTDSSKISCSCWWRLISIVILTALAEIEDLNTWDYSCFWRCQASTL